MAERTINAQINVEFDEADSRENISSGENIKTMMGKISKYISDTKSIAYSNDYNDLDNAPISTNNNDLYINNNTGVVHIGTGGLDVTGSVTAKTFSGNATSATKATNDGSDQEITVTYIKDLSASGNVITYTKGNNETGTVILQDSTYPNATITADGLMSAADKTKLEGIDAGAQVNSVTGVKGDSETSYRTGQINITKANIGLDNVENKSAATIISEISASDVTSSLGYTPLNSNLKGAVNGLAELDSNGTVPAAQLPSYVDDVLEGYYDSNTDRFYIDSSFTDKIDEESGKIYVCLSSKKIYRWSGSTYVVISETLALGTTSSTAYRGDYGNTAYVHSQLTSGNPHNVTLSDLGVTSSATELNYVSGVTESIQTQLSGKADVGHTHMYAGSTTAGGSATSAVKLDTSTAGSATQPVYFTSGKPTACTYTIEASVPSDAKFTDTNTWRGVQNVLTSTSTTESLSAAQGKALKDLIDDLTERVSKLEATIVDLISVNDTLKLNVK